MQATRFQNDLHKHKTLQSLECCTDNAQRNELCARLWQKEGRLGGVGVCSTAWTSWRAGRQLHCIISREYIKSTVRRRWYTEHCTTVDLALIQLLKHSVSLLHRKDTEHWWNYLQHITHKLHRQCTRVIITTTTFMVSSESHKICRCRD